MKIVNIIGGLGNQMFQYAFYLALRSAYSSEQVKIYTAANNGYKLHNSYELDKVFGISAPEANGKEVGRFAYPFGNYSQWQIANHLLPKRKGMFKEEIFGRYYDMAFRQSGDCFFDGYWQNECYFHEVRNIVTDSFTPVVTDGRNVSFADMLGTSNSVSIHVRRGDYVKSKIYSGICDLDYYKRAVKEITYRACPEVFCVFSDDVSWCRDSITPLLGGHECIMPDWNTGSASYLDMYLMSRCRHNIIANSSFSWWGAWLNRHTDKVVIGPKKWTNMKSSEFRLPTDWITI